MGVSSQVVEGLVYFAVNSQDVVAPQSEAATPPYQSHIGDSRPYWRDIILGVNDGLVSMLLLVAGEVDPLEWTL